MHFVPTVPYISDIPLSIGTIYKQIVQTSLVTLKIGTSSLTRELPKYSRKKREDTTSSLQLVA